MIDEVVKILSEYTVYKKSSKTLIVFTNEDRLQVQKTISDLLPTSLINSRPTSKSSIGFISYHSIQIYVKPLKYQGIASNGMKNEFILFTNISQHLENPKNIIFKSDQITYSVNNCNKVTFSTSFSNRRKADLLLHTDTGIVPISIKKDNAQYWESADSFYKKKAEEILEDSITNNRATLTSNGSYFILSPNIAIKASKEESKSVVFGSDIYSNGCIITKTFETKDFNVTNTNITIQVSDIIRTETDISESKQVYLDRRASCRERVSSPV